MAAVERGGLRYPIEVVDRFSDPLLRFRDDLQAARASWNEFRADVSALKGNSTGIRQMAAEAKSAAAALDRQAAAATEAAKASEASKKGIDVHKLALESLKRELLATQVATEKERIALQQGIATRKQAAEMARKQAEANKAVAASAKLVRKAQADAAKEAAKAQAAAERELNRGIRAGGRVDAQVRQSEANTARIIERDRQRAINDEIARGRRDAIAILERFDQQQAAQAKATDQQSTNSARAIQERARFVENYRQTLRRMHAQEEAANSAQTKGHTASLNAALRAKKAVDLQNKSLDRAEVFGNRLIFTFRRLIGAFAVFQAARAAATGFSALLSTGIAFNQTLEQSRLGIAGLITSVGKLTDAQGNVIEGAEKYAQAQRVAADQQEKLRQDALNTTATYRELLDAFQQGLAPGLNANIKDLDKIRQIVVLTSQAMTALGQPQDQFGEEIRALFTGRIRPGQSRVATAIGLTPEQVKTAKEFGTLEQLLTERLKGFALAAEDTAKTTGGLFQRLKDVLELVTGRASEGLFNDLRDTLQSAFDALTVRVNTDLGAVLKPDPEVQKAFEALYTAVSRVLKAVRETGDSIGKQGFINLAKSIGAVIETVGVGLVNLIAGAIKGITILRVALVVILEPIKAIGATIRSVFGQDVFGEVTRGAIALLTVMAGFRVLVTALGGSFNLVASAVSGVLRLVIGTNGQLAITKLLTGETAAGFRSVAAGILKSVGVTVLLVTGLKEVLSWATGIELSFSDLPEVIGAAFERMFAKLFANIDLFSIKFYAFITRNLKKALVAVQQFASDVIAAIDDSFGSNTGPEEVAKQQARQNDELARQNQLRAELVDLELQVAEATKVRDQVSKDADSNAISRIEKLRAEVEKRNALIASAANPTAPQGAGGAGGSLPTVTGLGTAPTLEEKNALVVARQKNEILRAQVGLEGEVTRLTVGRASQAEIDLATSQANLEVLRQEAALRAIELQQRIEVLQAEAESELNEERKKVLQGQAIALIGEKALEEQKTTAELAKQEEIIRRQQQILTGSINEGFGQGLVDFAQQFASSFEAGINIAKGLLSGFVDLVSSSIVDAFDPTQKFDLKERFARFLQDIAKLIIQQLTQIAIAKAILGLGFADGGQIPGAPATGRAHGGAIPRHSPRRASLAHVLRPRGLAHGGRPAGLHPTDTVPIWAAPGEWMMRVSAVRKYGIDVMARINEGLVDPTALRGIAAAGGSRPAVGVPKAGFADGGAVTRPSAVSGGAAATVVPALVASEESMAALIAGGERSLIDFMRRNADVINSGRKSRF